MFLQHDSSQKDCLGPVPLTRSHSRRVSEFSWHKFPADQYLQNTVTIIMTRCGILISWYSYIKVKRHIWCFCIIWLEHVIVLRIIAIPGSFKEAYEGFSTHICAIYTYSPVIYGTPVCLVITVSGGLYESLYGWGFCSITVVIEHTLLRHMNNWSVVPQQQKSGHHDNTVFGVCISSEFSTYHRPCVYSNHAITYFGFNASQYNRWLCEWS